MRGLEAERERLVGGAIEGHVCSRDRAGRVEQQLLDRARAAPRQEVDGRVVAQPRTRAVDIGCEELGRVVDRLVGW